MIRLESSTNGVILPVRAHAGGRKNAITGEHGGMLKVSVTQAPEKGKANQAIIVLLAQVLGLGKHQISLVAGETSSHKRFLITGASTADLSAILRTLGIDT